MEAFLPNDDDVICIADEDSSSSTFATSYTSSSSDSDSDTLPALLAYGGVAGTERTDPERHNGVHVNEGLELSAARLQQIGNYGQRHDDGLDGVEAFICQGSDEEDDASETPCPEKEERQKTKPRKKRRRRRTTSGNIPPPKLVSGKRSTFSIKVNAKKDGKIKRPTVFATFRRVPNSSGQPGIGGFSRKKVLVDTGATRTAITHEMALDILKLRPRGSTHITTGDGVKTERLLVRISVEVCNTTSYVWATVRPPHALKHCILGIDWVGTVRPDWVYADRKKKPRKKRAVPAAASSSFRRKGSKKNVSPTNEAETVSRRKTALF